MKTGESNGGLPVAERIAYLIVGYLQKKLTEAEHDELDAWVVASEENLRLFEELTDEENIQKALDWQKKLDQQKALSSVKEQLGMRRKAASSPRAFWLYGLTAAVLLTAAALFLLQHPKKEPISLPLSQGPNSVPRRPWYQRAVLTLDGGRTIILDSSLGKGVIANEGNISIQKNASAQIIYSGEGQEMKYNTVSTPRGGQYSITLGDGTTVWLNAESSLRFPAGFARDQRTVELKGEGYFEVAKNPSKPFIVTLTNNNEPDIKIEVLGTHFNINAYRDEGAVKATLLEGSVRVKQKEKSALLSPNQQAIIQRSIRVMPAEGARTIGWKDGLFVFHEATIQTVAAELARWYDIHIVFGGKINFHFNGTIERTENLQSVLDFLEATQQVHFTRSGNTVTIQP